MKNNTTKGFTIIEVSLVLAIAGLIFLMVFVALPGLRASQRDTERRTNIMTFLEEVKGYQKNNRGALPGVSQGEVEVTWDSAKNAGADDISWSGFYKNYLGENFMDPDGVNYVLEVINCDASSVGAACATGDGILADIYDAGRSPFPNGYRMAVVLQAKCNGSEAQRTSNPRKLAVLYRLESAGVYCNDA